MLFLHGFLNTPFANDKKFYRNGLVINTRNYINNSNFNFYICVKINHSENGWKIVRNLENIIIVQCQSLALVEPRMDFKLAHINLIQVIMTHC